MNGNTQIKLYSKIELVFRVFIRHRRSENSLATAHYSPAKFCLFPERALLFHNNSPVTLHYSPVTKILNENHESYHSIGHQEGCIHYTQEKFSMVLCKQQTNTFYLLIYHKRALVVVVQISSWFKNFQSSLILIFLCLVLIIIIKNKVT